jgi:hypothetical protein
MDSQNTRILSCVIGEETLCTEMCGAVRWYTRANQVVKGALFVQSKIGKVF